MIQTIKVYYPAKAKVKANFSTSKATVSVKYGSFNVEAEEIKLHKESSLSYNNTPLKDITLNNDLSLKDYTKYLAKFNQMGVVDKVYNKHIEINNSTDLRIDTRPTGRAFVNSDMYVYKVKDKDLNTKFIGFINFLSKDSNYADKRTARQSFESYLAYNYTEAIFNYFNDVFRFPKYTFNDDGTIGLTNSLESTKAYYLENVLKGKPIHGLNNELKKVKEILISDAVCNSALLSDQIFVGGGKAMHSFNKKLLEKCNAYLIGYLFSEERYGLTTDKKEMYNEIKSLNLNILEETFGVKLTEMDLTDNSMLNIKGKGITVVKDSSSYLDLDYYKLSERVANNEGVVYELDDISIIRNKHKNKELFELLNIQIEINLKVT